MSTEISDFIAIMKGEFAAPVVCKADKLCAIDADDEGLEGERVDIERPDTKIIVLGTSMCAPCQDVKNQLGSDPRVTVIDMENPESEAAYERAMTIINEAGWSGTTPAIYFEQAGIIKGELWEGERDTEPGSLDDLGDMVAAEEAEAAAVDEAEPSPVD